MPDPADLGSATWPEAGDRADRLLLVPLGATEQHGPHLPLGTDTIIAEAWASAVAQALDDSVVAPTVAYGSSGEHQGFAGTLSIGAEALHLLVVELARSARHSFGRVAFLSGHAGNDAALRAAIDQLRDEGHQVCHLVPSWPGSTRPIDAHAGRTETSLLLHLRPEVVRARQDWQPGETRPLATILDRLVTEGVAAVSANGVLGDPGGASRAEGKALFDDLVARTVSTLSGPWPAPAR